MDAEVAPIGTLVEEQQRPGADGGGGLDWSFADYGHPRVRIARPAPVDGQKDRPPAMDGDHDMHWRALRFRRGGGTCRQC